MWEAVSIGKRPESEGDGGSEDEECYAVYICGYVEITPYFLNLLNTVESELRKPKV